MKASIVALRKEKQLKRLLEVLSSRTSILPPSNAKLEKNCLIHNGKAGTYGNFYYQGKVNHLHRLSYMLEHGEIPIGKNVLHLCNRKECSEVSHLYLGTQVENMKDVYNKDWREDEKKEIEEVEQEMQEFIQSLKRN